MGCEWLTKTLYYGEMAEWLIASVLKTEVLKGTGGSNPSLSAKNSSLAQWIRALRYGRRGWGFESLRNYEWKVTQVGEGVSLLN